MERSPTGRSFASATSRRCSRGAVFDVTIWYDADTDRAIELLKTTSAEGVRPTRDAVDRARGHRGVGSNG